VVLGLFLLAAAGLKAYGLTLDPVDPDSFFASPRLLLATVEIEVLLGLWLLSGWALRASWVAALGFFGILTCVSLYSALIGQESCGCFGRVPVNPWFTFVLDGASCATLGYFRPSGKSDLAGFVWRSGALKIHAGTGGLLVLVGSVFLAAFDSPMETLARLRGESITIAPVVTQLGEGKRGDTQTFSVRLTNHSNKQVHIVGGTTRCACTATEDLPITLEPGESQSIDVHVKFVGSTGAFQHRFVLMTDDAAQGVVVARFAGRVLVQEE
jgi:hypothetical protein